MVELIAHRAANEPGTIAAAVGVADWVELDVHRFRGRLEVRHAKVLRPLALYWERGEFVGRHRYPVLRDILDGCPPDARLWVDLKGFTPGLTRRVLDATAGRPLTISTRVWWLLRPAAGRPGVRALRSIGAPWQLQVALRRPHRDDAVGHVINQRLLTTEVADALVARHPTLVTWGVTTVERAVELIELGVTGIIADDLDLLAEIRQNLGNGRDHKPAAPP